jgi:hypothetical protein
VKVPLEQGALFCGACGGSAWVYGLYLGNRELCVTMPVEDLLGDGGNRNLWCIA